MKHLSLACMAASALLSANAMAAPINGPIGTYYITDGGNAQNPGIIYAIKDHATGSTNMNDQANQSEYPIAVNGQEVHTTGFGNTFSGSAYTGVAALTLTPTAAFYPGSTDARMTDGTTDGTHNYGVTYGALGGTEGAKVFQFNTNWGNKQLLFNIPDIQVQGDKNFWNGITYDPTNNSLWMSNLDRNVVADFDLTGNLIANSLFSTAADTTMYALALDVDHTLWMTGNPSSGGSFSLYHYQTNGAFIGSFLSNPALISPIGGEIGLACAPDACCATPTHPCPEPGTLGLFGIGLLGLIGRKRRAKSA